MLKALNRTILTASLVLLVAAVSYAQSAEPAPADKKAEAPAKAPEKKLLRTVIRNFEMMMGPNKIGGSVATAKFFEDGSRELHEKSLIRISRDMGTGTPDIFEIRSSSTKTMDAKLNTLRAESEKIEGGIKTTSTEDYTTPGKLTFTSKGPASNVNKTVDLPEGFSFTEVATQAAIARHTNDGVDRGATFKVFSEARMDFVDNSVNVIGKENLEFDGITHSGHRVSRKLPEGPAMELVDADGIPMSGMAMGIISITWVKHDPMDFEASKASISSMLDANVCVRPWRLIESMSLTLTIEGDAEEGALVKDDHYHTVKRDGNVWMLKLKHNKLSDKDAAAPELPMVEVPEDVKPFLDPTPLCQSDHEDIQAKARELARDAKDSVKVTRSIVRWVFGAVGKESGARGNATATEVLTDLKGDCTEHSALTVALLRAAGVPARNCTGIVYLTMGNKGVFGYHAWSEAWLGKWVPIDATVNEVGTTARYILFGYNEPKMDDGTAQVARTLLRTTMNITAYQLMGEDEKKVEAPKKDGEKPVEKEPAKEVPAEKPVEAPAGEPQEVPGSPKDADSETPSSLVTSK